MHKNLLENRKGRDHQGDLCVLEDNIKLYLVEIRYEGADYIHLTQDKD
jgi:hypothetical protein